MEGTRLEHGPPVTGAADRAARWVVVGALAYLLLMWSMVTAVDAANLFGLRDALEQSDADVPAMWWQLNWNGRPTEWVQWGLLAAFALVSARLAAQLQVVDARAAARFWGVLAVLGVLLLIEDAGDPRHTLARWAVWATGQGFARLGAELLFFLMLGAVAGYALVLYGAVLRRSPSAFRTMWLGVLVYAAAGIMSATRDLGGWYIWAGGAIRERLFGGAIPDVDIEDGRGLSDGTDYYLMDSLVEESIELVAATLLLVAVLRYLSHLRRDPGIAEVHDGLWAREHLWSRVSAASDSTSQARLLVERRGRRGWTP